MVFNRLKTQDVCCELSPLLLFLGQFWRVSYIMHDQ